MLKAHNDYRTGVLNKESKKQNPPLKLLKPLEWNDVLANYSQAWADKISKTKGCPIHHSTDRGNKKIKNLEGYWGENIYKSGGNKLPDPMSVVKFWYDEVFCYRHGPYGSDSDTRQCTVCTEQNEHGCSSCTDKEAVVGHFTQIMWTETTKLGCGATQCDKAASGSDGHFVSCAYHPGGNGVGPEPFTKEVAKALDISPQPKCCDDKDNAVCKDSSIPKESNSLERRLPLTLISLLATLILFYM